VRDNLTRLQLPRVFYDISSLNTLVLGSTSKWLSALSEAVVVVGWGGSSTDWLWFIFCDIYIC